MKSVSNKINFPELESRILEFWRQENIFRKSVEERPVDKEFIFYEILFNGTVQNFIHIMKNKKYNLNTQKKIWIIE